MTYTAEAHDTTFVDGLDLSVRTANGLENLGVTTFDEFMSLTAQVFLMQPNVGRVSWCEIEDVRERIDQDPFERTYGGDVVRALRALEIVNAFVRNSDTYHLALSKGKGGTAVLLKRLKL